jgi:hypothetical protein
VPFLTKHALAAAALLGCRKVDEEVYAMENPPKKLDVSLTDHAQKCEILRYAAEVRKFEIERFWQRSAFFWTFIGAAFVGYAALYDKERENTIPLVIASFGIISSFAWTLQNRGSKYWQEAWETKVESVEMSVLGTNLFSNVEPVQQKGFWGAKRYSVSKMAIAMSDFTCLIWIALMLKATSIHIGFTIGIDTLLIFIITIGYGYSLWRFGKSTPRNTH